MKIFTTIIFSLCLTVVSFGQVEEPMEKPLVHPTIMVIPFAKENEQLRTVYEQDKNLHLRVAVTKVKEAFEHHYIPTVDFRAKLKQLSNDKSMQIGNQSSIKQQVVELSGADIYVEVESSIIQDESGNSSTVTVTAYDAFSGQVLATDVGTTTRFYTYNFERLTEKAVNGFIKTFMYNIQDKFNQIVEQGRTVVVNIGFDENAALDMDSEMADGELFSDVLEKWFEENAYNNYFHVQGVTATKMILDEVRIPVINSKNGRSYRVTQFAAKLRSFLKKQNLEVTRDVVGANIYITIN
ncbi:MAG: DUF6175 family protein [Saprospiraceae bacterium]